MKLSYEDYDQMAIITMSGEFTADDTDTFRRTLGERFETGARHVVLDIEFLDQIDSAGLESLLWLQQQANRRNGQLRLVKPDDHILTILKMTRLERRFEYYDKVELAVRSVR
ncbi:MAG TPA: anti-sigma factor antagonist [Phycisphaeraceae bacterium]|nr:anti-sigma factor antagonist [Phycisphaeraceae bacterium]